MKDLNVFEFQRHLLKPLETVILKSIHSNDKGLLLKCVEQNILVVGQGTCTMSKIYDTSAKVTKSKESTDKRDTLRSGWKPILAVICIASQDIDYQIAELGFNMLTAQLRKLIFVDKSDKTSKCFRRNNHSNFISESWAFRWFRRCTTY